MKNIYVAILMVGLLGILPLKLIAQNNSIATVQKQYVRFINTLEHKDTIFMRDCKFYNDWNNKEPENLLSLKDYINLGKIEISKYDSIGFSNKSDKTVFNESDSTYILSFTKEYVKSGTIIKGEELKMTIIFKNGNAKITGVYNANVNTPVDNQQLNTDFDKKVWKDIDNEIQAIVHKSVKENLLNYISTASLLDSTEKKVTEGAITLFKENFEEVAQVINDMEAESNITHISNYTTRVLLNSEKKGVMFEMDSLINYEEVRLYDTIENIYRVTLAGEKTLFNGLNGQKYENGRRFKLEFIYYVYINKEQALIMYIKYPEKKRKQNRIILNVNQGTGNINHGNNANRYSDTELNFDFSKVSYTLISVGFQTNELGKKYGWQGGIGYGLTKFRNTINYNYDNPVEDDDGELYDNNIQIVNGREDIAINTLTPYIGFYRNLYNKRRLKINAGIDFQAMLKISTFVESQAIVDYQAFYSFVTLNNIPDFFGNVPLIEEGPLDEEIDVNIIPTFQPYLNAVFPFTDNWGMAIGVNYGLRLSPLIQGVEKQNKILLENYGESDFNTTQNYSEYIQLNTLSGQIQFYFNLN